MQVGGTLARKRGHRAGHVPVGPSGILAMALRDELGAAVAVTALLVLMCLAGGWTMATTYGTPATRSELAALAASMPPVLRGLYGSPIRIDTLGGFLSWHYGAYFALVTGLWSIISLSGCLAGEARRGSLDMLMAAPVGRRRVALEKAAAHVIALAAAMAVTAGWYDVGAASDIPLRGARLVKTPQGCLAVFRTAESMVFALEDRCPHKGGPLSQGIVHGHRVTCPLHDWVIELPSGTAVAPDEGRVVTYAVRLEDGVVFVATEPAQSVAA